MAAVYDPNDPNALDPQDPAAARSALLDQLGPDGSVPAPPAPSTPSVTTTPRTTTTPTSHLDDAGMNPDVPPQPGEPGGPTVVPTPTPTNTVAPGSPGAPPQSPTPTVVQGPAPVITPTTPTIANPNPPPAAGTAGTFQTGSPNDPAAQGNGTDANNYLLQLLNGGSGTAPSASLVNQINSQYGLPSGSGLEYYDNNGNPFIAASGGGYYAKAPGSNVWTYNAGDSGGGGSTSNTGGGPAPAPIAAPAVNQAWEQQMRDMLTSQLALESTPVTANSPSVAPAISAYSDQSTRDQQTARDALVEQLYAQGGTDGAGLNSGALDTGIRQNEEAASTARSNFAGNAVFTAGQAQLTQLNQLLATATQFGLTDQAQAIQAQIAQVQAQLTEQGYGINLAEFEAGLNQNTALAGLNG
jgi:hypothetical protein